MYQASKVGSRIELNHNLLPNDLNIVNETYFRNKMTISLECLMAMF